MAEFKEKNSILDWDLKPGPLAFRANALPTELSRTSTGPRYN